MIQAVQKRDLSSVCSDGVQTLWLTLNLGLNLFLYSPQLSRNDNCMGLDEAGSFSCMRNTLPGSGVCASAGQVDFAELAASLLDWQQFQAVEHEWDSWVERVFDRLDSDQNGYVDLAEIMAYATHPPQCTL